VSRVPRFEEIAFDDPRTDCVRPEPPAATTTPTPEGIDVAACYFERDLAPCTHLGSMPGFAPYVRGPYPTMYVGRPWTVRQYAGFSTAEQSNAF